MVFVVFFPDQVGFNFTEVVFCVFFRYSSVYFLFLCFGVGSFSLLVACFLSSGFFRESLPGVNLWCLPGSTRPLHGTLSHEYCVVGPYPRRGVIPGFLGLWGLRLGLGWLLRSMVIELAYLDLSLWTLSDHLTVSIRFELRLY